MGAHRETRGTNITNKNNNIHVNGNLVTPNTAQLQLRNNWLKTSQVSHMFSNMRVWWNVRFEPFHQTWFYAMRRLAQSWLVQKMVRALQIGFSILLVNVNTCLVWTRGPPICYMIRASPLTMALGHIHLNINMSLLGAVGPTLVYIYIMVPASPRCLNACLYIYIYIY